MQAIDAAVRFQDMAATVLEETSELTGALATNVVLAREYLKEVEISSDQVREGVCFFQASCDERRTRRLPVCSSFFDCCDE